MGCRSFLTVEDSQRNPDGSHKFYGRFNQGVVTINLVDVACSSEGDMEMCIRDRLVNGLSIGSIYALMAVGYSLIYSLLNFTNFAHSITVTIGAFLSLIHI